MDVIARAVAPRLAKAWGRPVSIDNRPGDGAAAAPSFVARAAPDGATLLMNSSAQAFLAAFRKDLPFDPGKDFVAVASISSQPYVYVAARHTGIASLQALVAAAKGAPGTLRFASPGAGTASYVGSMKLNHAAGIRAAHVPAKPGEGIARVIASTIAGGADYLLAPIPFALEGIRSGDLVPLGVSGSARSPLMPDVPTIAEAAGKPTVPGLPVIIGLIGFDYRVWYGIWAPVRTPEKVVKALAAGIALALVEPETRQALADHGAEPLRMTQPEFASFVFSEAQAAVALQP